MILLARLSLYGHGASRLHDEVLAVAAEWDPTDPNRRLRKLSLEKTGRALEELQASLQQRLEAPEGITAPLQAHLGRDVAQLREALDQQVEARRLDAAAPTRTSTSCCWSSAASRTSAASWRTTAGTGSSACRRSTATWSGSPSASAAPSRCRPTGWSRRARSTRGRSA